MNNCAISVKNVNKTFRVYYDRAYSLRDKLIFRNRNRFENRVVLKDVSFDIPKGKAVGIIGTNGSGKSTTLKLLSRILYPDGGSITMNGRVSALIELGAGFHPDMTGRENIYINASIFGFSKKEIDKSIDDIIAFSELEDYIDNPVRTYSSGMYMRLAFSIAINVNADILLIDEILAVGDLAFQDKCYRKLQEIKNSDVTIVIISHNIEAIEMLCDSCIWIKDGAIEQMGETKVVTELYKKYVDNKNVR